MCLLDITWQPLRQLEDTRLVQSDIRGKCFDVRFDGPYAFTEVQRDRLLELEDRLAECRPEKEAKLCDYVLQHKGEFVFGASQEKLASIGA